MTGKTRWSLSRSRKGRVGAMLIRGCEPACRQLDLSTRSRVWSESAADSCARGTGKWRGLPRQGEPPGENTSGRALRGVLNMTSEWHGY